MHKFFANSLFVGKNIVNLPHCHSTNAIAGSSQSQTRQPEGTVFITQNQTAGRGQRGNAWESEPGKNLTFSVILYPHFLQVKDQFYLNEIISLAVAKTLESFLEPVIQVKWPNDILVEHKKICGILIENSLKGSGIDYTIVGIGLNVNQKQIQSPKATSMSNLALHNYDLEVVLESLLLNIEKQYLRLRGGSFQQIQSDYLQNLYMINQTHDFEISEGKISGIIRGIDPSGKLEVERDGKVDTYEVKEIKFL